MQGIFVDGGLRPKSKKQVKELVAERPEAVFVESTSLFGNEFSGAAADLPEGTTVYFVGPDPSRSRKFYGQLKRNGEKLVVT